MNTNQDIYTEKVSKLHHIYMVFLLKIFVFFVILDFIISMEEKNKEKYFIILFSTSILIIAAIYYFYVLPLEQKYENIAWMKYNPSPYFKKNFISPAKYFKSH